MDFASKILLVAVLFSLTVAINLPFGYFPLFILAAVIGQIRGGRMEF